MDKESKKKIRPNDQTKKNRLINDDEEIYLCCERNVNNKLHFSVRFRFLTYKRKNKDKRKKNRRG